METSNQIERGTVRWFSDEKGYGFIEPDSGGDDLFVHYTQIDGTGRRRLKEFQRVEFERVPMRKPAAKNVRVIAQ